MCGNVLTFWPLLPRPAVTSAPIAGSAPSSSGNHWWWMRGAAIASCADIFQSTTFMNTCAVAVMMVGPPAAPTTTRTRPASSSAIVGVIDDSGRLRGATAFCSLPIRPNALGTPGSSEKSSISSLSTMPVLPATRWAPKPRLMVVVSATALPSASITDRCDVPPSLRRRGRRPQRPVRVARQHRARLDPARQLGVIAGAGQVRHVDRDEVGVAQVAGAIGEGVLERLGQHVKLRGAPARLARRRRARRIARRQDPQRLDQRDAARRRRRHRRHPQAAIAGLERRAVDGRVAARDPRPSSRRPPRAPPSTISFAISPL